ncbi:3-deoxy-D-manno-octulosonic acid kinase [Halorhodospira halochloris]|uniref:3-deoxy-D-manno-octulosonic acid kinase n=1 Tax=Halorhodospira halochloris TaxID=1052 RepID=A0A110B4Y5_HALHR|nr:3-deoxy-D-manno-octulosonic acid kinase [Halorhodospira halochloris]MBK1650641.1 3-deoxy-D-manno-octulosonic acid kinase [Halorhodospira halochloris]BAU56873.2 3-deoxy-D-manno-octulosonic acid kinase [Halorhodospira halochloris]
MDPHQMYIDNQYIIYDAERLQRPDTSLFDPLVLQRRGVWLGAPAGGRGSAGYIILGGVPAVLRRYRRGGMFAPLLGDRYLWLGLAKTRPWREWNILARLHSQGMPVPAPIAARVQRRGVFYRADIVVERIDAVTLAERLSAEALAPDNWYEIGHAVGRLHLEGVDHADLNAHNVLINKGDALRVRIIDFDRARLRSPGRRWQLRNLARLQRSLLKLARQDPEFKAPDQKALAELQRGWSEALRDSQQVAK